MRTLLAFCTLLFVLQLTAVAQDSCWLKVSGMETAEKGNNTQLLGFADSISRNAFMQEQLMQLADDGYITATFKFTAGVTDTLQVHLLKGPQVQWAQLKVNDADKNLLSAADYKPGTFEDKPYDHQRVVALLRDVVMQLANRGYPFAVVQLDSIAFADSVLQANLRIQRNTFIQFDSVIVVGNLDVSKNFIQQYTGIKNGEPYQQSLIDALPERIIQLTYASLTKPPVIEFSGNSARVIIYADARKTSRFDFILGVLPNNAITGRLIVTGDVQLQLQNTFGAGEQINFQYNKLESATKSLDASVVYPYLPGIPLGPDASFYLYLKDSTFLERKTTLGMVYQFSGNNTLKGFVNWFNSSVLKPDTTFVLSNLELPAMLDMADLSYGLSWQYRQLDNIFNPRKGYFWQLTASAGSRNILENASIAGLTSELYPDYDFASLYDSIDTKIFSLRYQYDVQYYQPLFSQTVLLLQMRGGALVYDQLLANELYRLGGNKLLRGFDEQSLPVSDYHLGTIEWRYLLGARSYAGLFVDAGYLSNRTISEHNVLHPVGFGATVRFETKAGIFGLTYALGGTELSPVAFKNTKVHFGYINYF